MDFETKQKISELEAKIFITEQERRLVNWSSKLAGKMEAHEKSRNQWILENPLLALCAFLLFAFPAALFISHTLEKEHAKTQIRQSFVKQ